MIKKRILSLCIGLLSFFIGSSVFALSDVSWSASDYTAGATTTYTFNFTNEWSERDPSLRIIFPEGFEYVGSDLYADISVSMSGGSAFAPAYIDGSFPLFDTIAMYSVADTLIPAFTPFTVTIANIRNPSVGTYEWASNLEFFWEGSEDATLSDIEIVGAEKLGCIDYSGSAFLGSVILNPDGTVIGCDDLENIPSDLLPGGSGWENYFTNEWPDFTPRLGWACDDCYMGADAVYGESPVPLGFNINYYGRTYSGIFIGSNGSVTFDEGSSNYDQPLQDILGNGPGICIYCIDLENDDQLEDDDYVRGSGRHVDMFYRGRTTVSGRPAFVITWINMPQYSSDNGPSNTFQIVFVDVSDANDDVDIILNYGSITDAGEDNQGYCENDGEEEESNCELVAIGLGSFTSDDELIYNSLLNDNDIALNGRSILELVDGGTYALTSNRLNSDMDGRYRFAMVNGSLPGSVGGPEEDEEEIIVPPVRSGGGGGYSLSQDSCPNGDYSPSYYDGSCGEAPQQGNDENDEEKIENSDEEITIETILNPSIATTCFSPLNKKTIFQGNNVTDQFKIAHQMFYSYGLTMWRGTEDYRPNDYMTREEASKIMVEFAQRVLCRKPVRVYTNNFSDLELSNSNLTSFIKASYEYGIFKGHDDGTFRPTDRISNDELTAIMIRLVTNTIWDEPTDDWASPYRSQIAYYTKISSLNNNGRGNIAEVLYDLYRNNEYILKDVGYVIQ